LAFGGVCRQAVSNKVQRAQPFYGEKVLIESKCGTKYSRI